MSFIRPGQGRAKRKAFVRKRPQWDESVNDLDAYRATPEEVRLRKEAHKSKNHIAVKLEKMRKEKQRQRAGLTNVEARHVAILKEVLHDQQQKFTGFPNVTMPPGNQKSSSSLPSAPEIRTRTEVLSESMMSQSALNDLSETESSDSDTEDQHAEPVNFQSQLDLQRFQHFLQQEENRNSNALPSSASMSQTDIQRLQQLQQFLRTEEPTRDGGDGLSRGAGPRNDNNQTLSTISGTVGASIQFSQHPHGPAHSTHLLADPGPLGQVLLAAGGRLQLPGYQTPPESSREAGTSQQTPPKSALNDTGKVKKSKRRVPQPESSQNTSSLNMADMRKVLESLEAEIADFERKTGRRPATDVQRTETFTGYTVSLVTAVTKLTHYLKETEMRLQAEMMVREQLTQDVRQLALTIDSLTQEIIMTQEEYGKLYSEHHSYRQQMQGEMALLQAQVLDLKHHQSSHGSQGSQHSTPGKAASAAENQEESFSALPNHVTEPSAAVLLSPVVRKTRIHDRPQPEPLMQKRQTSLIDLTSLAEDGSTQQKEQHQSTVQLKATTSVTVSSGASGSASSSTRTDPPRLTQAPPVMATVSVPRPIPLVQSNVGVSLPGSHAAGPVTQPQSAHSYSAQSNTTVSSAASGNTRGQQQPPARSQTGAPSSVSNTRAMENQIAELNRQHAEAQQRLQSLLAQQKRQHNQLEALHAEDGCDGEDGGQLNHKPRPVQEGVVPSTVSPPISPISQRSEHFTSLNPGQRLASMSREIKVALPTVDLEVSGGSLGSPP
ncbi:hypothetical protein BaRGS_00007685 [Batillaria attramentaria]|uniref:Spindle and centriole-associated protein 1 n=1 Tax=Batillaria attramentaria TaxID=370345 RepID=A0ABD0LNV3_9CAEN